MGTRAFKYAFPHPLRGTYGLSASPGGGVDAEGGSVLGEVFAVAAVGPGLADGGVLGGHLLDEGLAGDGVLHARGRDQRSRPRRRSSAGSRTGGSTR